MRLSSIVSTTTTAVQVDEGQLTNTDILIHRPILLPPLPILTLRRIKDREEHPLLPQPLPPPPNLLYPLSSRPRSIRMLRPETPCIDPEDTIPLPPVRILGPLVKQPRLRVPNRIQLRPVSPLLPIQFPVLLVRDFHPVHDRQVKHRVVGAVDCHVWGEGRGEEGGEGGGEEYVDGGCDEEEVVEPDYVVGGWVL